jgi:hypothetical protein
MEGIVIPDLKKKPRFLSKGAAQVPVLMHFQPSDTTMQTRRFYGAAARTIFERCEHRLIDLPLVSVTYASLILAPPITCFYPRPAQQPSSPAL